METFQLDNGDTIFHNNGGESRSLFQEIFVDGCYERAANELETGDVVFDVGANIGLAALYLHRRTPGLRFFCFEPLPAISAILRANLQRHEVNATVLQLAASDRAGSTQFTYYPNNSMLSGMHSNFSADSAVTARYLQNNGVDQESIDYLLEDKFRAVSLQCGTERLSKIIAEAGIERIGLLKIDVEKSELQVLDGIDDAHWPLIRRVCIEVHDIDSRLAQISAMFERRGFTVDVTENAALAGTGLFDVFAARRVN
jgi:31-O-methyltransferase